MFIVALGGAVGSSLRMAVSRIVDTYAVGHFPYPHHDRQRRRLSADRRILWTVHARQYWRRQHQDAAHDGVLRRLHHVQHLLQREPHAPS